MLQRVNQRINHWLNQHPAFQHRGSSFRICTILLVGACLAVVALDLYEKMQPFTTTVFKPAMQTQMITHNK